LSTVSGASDRRGLRSPSQKANTASGLGQVRAHNPRPNGSGPLWADLQRRMPRSVIVKVTIEIEGISHLIQLLGLDGSRGIRPERPTFSGNPGWRDLTLPGGASILAGMARTRGVSLLGCRPKPRRFEAGGAEHHQPGAGARDVADPGPDEVERTCRS